MHKSHVIENFVCKKAWCVIVTIPCFNWIHNVLLLDHNMVNCKWACYFSQIRLAWLMHEIILVHGHKVPGPSRPGTRVHQDIEAPGPRGPICSLPVVIFILWNVDRFYHYCWLFVDTCYYSSPTIVRTMAPIVFIITLLQNHPQFLSIQLLSWTRDLTDLKQGPCGSITWWTWDRVGGYRLF